MVIFGDFLKGTWKKVLYIAVPKNENLKMQESEIEDIKWYNFDEALKILTFENWKELLKKVIKDIK